MKRIKDIPKIKQMLKKGETSFSDPETGYTYTLCALCPRDGHECSMASVTKEIGEGSKISSVTFYCPLCDTRFDAKPAEMFLR